MYKNEKGQGEAAAIGLLAFIIFIGILFVAWAWPTYRVWQREMSGQAELAEAEWTRKIAVEEARARMESAELDREAEIIRARGVAEANEIIADGLGGPEGYLRYLWINAMSGDAGERIYIPTEAGMPILEARDNK